MSERVRPQRILIASSHALFGQGLRSLLLARQKADVEVVGMVSNLGEALAAIDMLEPDLVIVDYDDRALNREEFLTRFVGSEKKLRVVLLSLQNPEEAIVYDRRTMQAAQVDRWLEEWPTLEAAEKPGLPPPGEPVSEHRLRRNNMKHLIIAGILVILVTALLIVGLSYAHLLPVEASLQAVPIDWMFGLEFKVIAFLFALIVVFMVYSIVVFRRKPGDTTDARHIEGNVPLEVTWTVIPLITVLAWGTWLAPSQTVPLKNQQIRMFYVACANLLLAFLISLFHGLGDLTTDMFWLPFLGGQGPAPGYAMSLNDERRAALRDRLHSSLPFALNGSIPLVARAWAVRGAKP